MTTEDIKLFNGVLATLYFVRACRKIGSDAADEAVDEYIKKLAEHLDGYECK